MYHSVRIHGGLAIDTTPASVRPDSILARDSGDSTVKATAYPDSVGFADSSRAAGRADTADYAYSSPGGGSSVHGVDSPFVAYAINDSTWQKTCLKYLPESDPILKLVNDPFDDGGYKKFEIQVPDSVALKLSANPGSYLTLYGKNSCCAGTFWLNSDSGYSYIHSRNLNNYTDSNATFQSVTHAINSTFITLNPLQKTNIFATNSDDTIYMNGSGVLRVVGLLPAISMTDTIPIVRGDGRVGRISGSSFRVGIGAASPVQIADTCDVRINGDSGYVPVFTGAHSIGNSSMYDSSSNIGIGTTYPVGALHIKKTGVTSQLRIESDSNHTNQIVMPKATGSRQWQITHRRNSDENILDFNYYSGSGKTSLKLDTNGNVIAKLLPITTNADTVVIDSAGYLKKILKSIFLAGKQDTVANISSNEIAALDSIITVTTPYCSLFDGATYRARAQCYIKKGLETVRIQLPELSGEITSSTITTLHFSLPLLTAPASNLTFYPLYPYPMDNGTEKVGWMKDSTSSIIRLYGSTPYGYIEEDATFTMYPCEVHWITN